MSNDPIRDVLFPSDDPTMASPSDLAARRIGLEKSLREFSQTGRFANPREQDERDARVDVLRQVLESNRELVDVVVAQGESAAAVAARADQAHRMMLLWVRMAFGVTVLGVVVAVVLALGV